VSPAGQLSPRRLYLAVAACAAVVYVGCLWNRFAFDDLYAVVLNPLVHHPSGLWKAFGSSYWAGNLNTTVYRPLAVASFALDGLVGSPAWFHAVNLLWHVAATVLVAVLARRWAGNSAALVAGLLFAVHPVHVEAVANVVGRNELMAATFALVAVYAALARESVVWSAVALVGGLLSKENAAVVPGLIVWAWLVRLVPRPGSRRVAAFVTSWVLIAAGYAALRWIVFRAYGQGITAVAPVFIGQSPLDVRLTAVSGLVDVARLLLVPLHLQADYSPLERTAVTSLADWRLGAGLLVCVFWALLLALALKRQRRLEAFGLGWIAIAYTPVANLLFPIGVFIAERTLYLPSVGLVLAIGGLARDVPSRRLALPLAVLVLAGGLRTALRVPAWRDNLSATVSLATDAPRSYRTYDYAGWQFLWAGEKRQALEAFLHAADLFDRDHRIYLAAADAAFSLGRPALADSLLTRADRVCAHCLVSYHNQAGAARLRGDSASADSLLAHARRLESR
jgi:protein O-mannosyl-transferase